MKTARAKWSFEMLLAGVATIAIVSPELASGQSPSPTPRQRAVVPSTARPVLLPPNRPDSAGQTIRPAPARAPKRELAPPALSPARVNAEMQRRVQPPPPGLPDLAFASIRYRNDRAEIAIVNKGSANAGPFRVVFTAGGKSSIRTFHFLRAGKTEEFKTGLFPGTQLMGEKTVQIDPLQQVVESNESNNTSTSNFPPQG
jgi:hypothetical protein